MRRSKYAKNKSELAQRIGLTRPTLYALFKRPDHPANHGEGVNKYNVEAWAIYAAANTSAHNRKGSGSNGHFPLSEREQSIIAKNRISSEREAFRLEKEKRNYYPIREVNQHIDTANAIVVRELRKAFEQELPPRQEGLSALEIKKLNAKRLDQIFASLPKHLKNAEGQN